MLYTKTKHTYIIFFYIKGPCIVKYMSIIVQQDATIYSLFISLNRSTCFGWYLQPLSGVHVTVSTASPVLNVTGRELQFPSSHVHGRLQLRFY